MVGLALILVGSPYQSWLALLSSHLPDPTHIASLRFSICQALSCTRPLHLLFLLPGPLPTLEWLTPSQPSDLSSNISYSERPFLTILSKTTPSHSFYLLTYQPVNLLIALPILWNYLVYLFVSLLISSIILNKKLLRPEARFILLYQKAYTRYSNILSEWMRIRKIQWQ